MNRILKIAVIAAVVFCNCGPALAALTGQYLFEEGSGTTALNTASNPAGDARNGTLNHVEGEDAAQMFVVGGPTYVPGLYKGSNYALLFNAGERDVVLLPQNQDFIRNAPGATVMAWVRVDPGNPNLHPDATPPTGAVFPTIVQVNNSTTVDPGGIGARAAITVSSSLGFRAVGSQGEEGRSSVNGASCSGNAGFICQAEYGQAYLVAGVLDYQAKTIKLYVDGQQIDLGTTLNASWASGNNSINASNLFASIGAAPVATASSTVAWHGAIDGVRIFNTALDATTILNTYNTELKVPVLGDYNGNGVVDAADYVVWRDGNIAADGTGPSGTPDGVVDGLDYAFWRAHFGNTTNPGGGSSLSESAAVPEPASLASVLIAIGLTRIVWPRRRTKPQLGVSRTSQETT
jgi:Concanavalin A-like lectin/glucanases superfamily